MISALPPKTNHEQAVRLRRNNQSGISGVRRVEDRSGIAWQATLLTDAGQKQRRFSVNQYGERRAKALAIAQRRDWLGDLPVKYLTHARHPEEIAQAQFASQLAPAADVLPCETLPEAEVKSRLAAIDARLEALRPPRLRVRVRRYRVGELSVFVSDAGRPARRELMHISMRR